MSTKEIVVRLFVDEETDDWGDGEVIRFHKLQNRFELVSTDIAPEDMDGIGEIWAQSDHYYETIQNLVAVFD